MFVLSSDLAAFLGKDQDPNVLDLANAHLPIVTSMVRAYTQGSGFAAAGEPADDIAAVIVSSCARYVSNPTGMLSETVGQFSVRYGVFNGWTLPEPAILHQYRRRAA